MFHGILIIIKIINKVQFINTL